MNTISMGAWDWVVCAVALVGSIVIGLWISMKEKSSDSSSGFFLAGRTLTWPIVGASLFATNISAEHLVGLSGDSYRYGLCAGTVELTTAMCLGFTAAILLPHYMRNKIFTIPEFLEIRYNTSARTAFSALMLVICIMTKAAFTLYAGALVLHLLSGWDIMTTIIALGGLTAIVTMIGGFTTVAYTDAIQTVIMLVGSGTMTLIGLHKVGGFAALCAQVPDAMHMAKPLTDANYPFWGIIAGAFYGGIFYWGMDQVNVQRLLGAKDLNHARWGAMFATLLKLTPVFIFALPGVIAFALTNGSLQGEQSKSTFVWLLNNLLPTGLRGLLLASLLAALISSLLAIMNSMSTLAVRDFFLRYKPKADEKSQVWTGRLAIIAGAALSICAAYLVYKTPDGLYKYLQTISIYLVMPITPAIAFGIMSKRVTIKGAAASVVAGIALAAVYITDQLAGVQWGEVHLPFLHKWYTANYTYRGLWGFIFVTAVLLIVSAFTAKTSADKLERTTVNWGAKREAFMGIIDWRIQWLALAIITILLYKLVW